MIDDGVWEIANKYLQKVKRSGPDNIMALCPFHDNKDTPSFTMSLSKGLFYCFSCQERGGLSTFLRNIGVPRLQIERTYQFIIDDLRSRAPQRPDILRPLPQALTNQPLPEWLLGHFDKCPTDLLDDGFDENMLQKLDIGFDETHMRITYPLRDLEGVLVGISGKTVTGDAPKYKVYDTEFKAWDLPVHKTHKSHLLWNGHFVYPQVYFANEATFIILVEGFKAAMTFIQAGIPNVMAILGAYISDTQKRYIERMASEVYMMLDNNKAGILGTLRAGSVLGVPTRVLSYPDEREQPSDLDHDEILLALSHPRDFHRWLLETPVASAAFRERRARQKFDSRKFSP